MSLGTRASRIVDGEGFAGPDSEAARHRRLAARRSIERALTVIEPANAEMALPDQKRPNVIPAIAELRRGRRADDEERVGAATLVDLGDGHLSWRDGFGLAPAGGPRRRGARGAAAAGKVVTPILFEKLAPNQVSEYLQGLDARFNPHQGLRRWTGDRVFRKVNRPSAKGRILLFVHGTFSKCDHLLDELNRTAAGQDLLRLALGGAYDEILGFDHPTLSVSPMINGLDLARAFAAATGPVDIVCHSRGGLVVRWWLEVFGGSAVPGRRVVMVGSPLAGTSLAAPPKLRRVLDLFTSIGTSLEVAGAPFAGIPFMAVSLGLLRVIKSVTGLAAHTPMVDAAFAMIPGLNGQSRVGNNSELVRLRTIAPTGVDYSAIKSDFRPKDEGWKFWKYFTNLGERVADQAANFVFEAENDLVVDTQSMTDLVDAVKISADGIFDYGTSDRVHHTNYFSQEPTAHFIMQRFGMV